MNIFKNVLVCFFLVTSTAYAAADGLRWTLVVTGKSEQVIHQGSGQISINNAGLTATLVSDNDSIDPIKIKGQIKNNKVKLAFLMPNSDDDKKMLDGYLSVFRYPDGTQSKLISTANNLEGTFLVITIF